MNCTAAVVPNLALSKMPMFVRARFPGLLMQIAQLARAVSFQGDQRQATPKAVQDDGHRLGTRDPCLSILGISQSAVF